MKRDSKVDDQEKAERIYQIIQKAVVDNPDIDPSQWAGALWSCIVDSYINSELSYDDFKLEMLTIIEHYKQWWGE